MRFIWVQLFLWHLLVGPAPSKGSAASAALIDAAGGELLLPDLPQVQVLGHRVP